MFFDFSNAFAFQPCLDDSFPYGLHPDNIFSMTFLDLVFWVRFLVSSLQICILIMFSLEFSIL